MAITWFLEPIGQHANENIAKWLEGNVTEAERHGTDTSDGKRNLYEVPFEKILQAIAGASFMFRVYRAPSAEGTPRPANVESLIRRAAKKGYFLPVMRDGESQNQAANGS